MDMTEVATEISNSRKTSNSLDASDSKETNNTWTPMTITE